MEVAEKAGSLRVWGNVAGSPPRRSVSRSPPSERDCAAEISDLVGGLAAEYTGRGSTRLAFQQTMREDLVAGIEAITGRRVRAGANEMTFDLAVETLLLVSSPAAPGFEPGEWTRVR